MEKMTTLKKSFETLISKLEGSEKQVKWATDILTSVLESIEIAVASDDKDLFTKYLITPTSKENWESTWDFICNQYIIAFEDDEFKSAARIITFRNEPILNPVPLVNCIVMWDRDQQCGMFKTYKNLMYMYDPKHSRWI